MSIAPRDIYIGAKLEWEYTDYISHKGLFFRFQFFNESEISKSGPMA